MVVAIWVLVVSIAGNLLLGAVRFLGSAKVVDPDGIVRASTGTRGGLAVATVDPVAERDEVQLGVDHLADRRPHTYGTTFGIDRVVEEQPGG